MNVIATKTRNRLLVKTISNMLFLSLVGPPQAKFEPATTCHLQVSLSCAVLSHILSLQYLSRSSHHRLAGLPCRIFLSYGLQVLTRDVHRSSLRRLICLAHDHYILLTLLIIYMTGVLSLTQMLLFLSLYVMLSILLSILVGVRLRRQYLCKTQFAAGLQFVHVIG